MVPMGLLRELHETFGLPKFKRAWWGLYVGTAYWTDAANIQTLPTLICPWLALILSSSLSTAHPTTNLPLTSVVAGCSGSCACLVCPQCILCTGGTVLWIIAAGAAAAPAPAAWASHQQNVVSFWNYWNKPPLKTQVVTPQSTGQPNPK